MSRPARVLIFALTEPDTGVVRHVGACGFWGTDHPSSQQWAADNQLRYLLSQERITRDRARTRVQAWIEHLRARGLEPAIRVLEVCSGAERITRRKHWEREYNSTRMTHWCPTGIREERWDDSKRAKFSAQCKARGQHRNLRGAHRGKRGAAPGGGVGEPNPEDGTPPGEHRVGGTGAVPGG